MHQLGANPAVDVGDCTSFGLGEHGHAVALALKNALYCCSANPLLAKKREKPFESSNRRIPEVYSFWRGSLDQDSANDPCSSELAPKHGQSFGASLYAA